MEGRREREEEGGREGELTALSTLAVLSRKRTEEAAPGKRKNAKGLVTYAVHCAGNHWSGSSRADLSHTPLHRYQGCGL